jgi:putative peptidoglycan lipid II flippase
VGQARVGRAIGTVYRSGYAEAGDAAGPDDVRAVPVIDIVSVPQAMPGLEHSGLLHLGGAVPESLDPVASSPSAAPVTSSTAPESGVGGVARNSAVMAVGTMVSRGTGLLRQVILAAVLGTAAVNDAYTQANTLPNMVYELLLGGVLTSVVVPLLVKAERTDPDGGEAFIQRLLTMTLALFAGVTAIAVVAAPILTYLVVSNTTRENNPARAHLATSFAYLVLIEILFYALAAVFGAILNSRNSFAAPMWAPVLNNGVVIATAATVLAMHGTATFTLQTITPSEVVVLGTGTTLGIVLQALSLWIPLRRMGFRWKLRWDWRGTGLGETRRLAGWLVLYVLLSQIGLFVTMQVADSAGATGHASNAIYNNAYLLFMLPHGIVAVSIITAMLPRMSRAAVDGRTGALADDLSLGTRLSATVLVPVAAIVLFLGPSIGLLLFGYGNTDGAEARAAGTAFAVASVGLLPFAISQIQTFVFYAMRDAKTPTFINAASVAVRVAGGVGVGLTVGPAHRVEALMLVNAVSYSVAMGVGALLLKRRIGTLHASSTLSAVVRVALASIPALLIAVGVHFAVTRLLSEGRFSNGVGLLLGFAFGAVAYAMAATALRVREVQQVGALVGRRLGRA